MGTVNLSFEEGSIVLDLAESKGNFLDGFKWDERALRWRAPASLYRDVILQYHKLRMESSDTPELLDGARGYEKCSFKLEESITPREHQGAALESWQRRGCYGVISLPTGAGKTILAVMAIAKIQRPTLVVVPTLDLVEQWRSVLSKYFSVDVGIAGGGSRDLQKITVATYHTAALIMESIGNHFGFLVCDECHHLPSPQFKQVALFSIAPYRLGLSATVERPDGGERLIYDLLGPLNYHGQISELVDTVLSPFEIVTMEIPLTKEEKAEYDRAREIYLRFVRQNRIVMSSPNGWAHFIREASFRRGGREALHAFRLQKKTAQGASLKIAKIWDLLIKHSQDRVLIFTNDNELAYRIGRELLLPVLTHQTRNKERKNFLEGFRSGALNVLVTSKVLNEGIDVPEASIGIVVSGSAAVREHVQRLGRILRQRPGKRALLYELISKNTSERFVNERRRKHSAYQGPSEVYP